MQRIQYIKTKGLLRTRGLARTLLADVTCLVTVYFTFELSASLLSACICEPANLHPIAFSQELSVRRSFNPWPTPQLFCGLVATWPPIVGAPVMRIDPSTLVEFREMKVKWTPGHAQRARRDSSCQCGGCRASAPPFSGRKSQCRHIRHVDGFRRRSAGSRDIADDPPATRLHVPTPVEASDRFRPVT